MTEVLLALMLIVNVAILAKMLVFNRFGLVKCRYAITLKDGEGEFIGMLIERRWDRLTFTDVVIPPKDASDHTHEVLGNLHVERANIAYLQELPE